jgi:hypothetical protein
MKVCFVEKGTKCIEYVIRKIRVFCHIPVQSCGTTRSCLDEEEMKVATGAAWIDAESCGNCVT